MVTVTVSPGLSQRLGVRPRPTPGGVPVETMSPGSSGVMDERYSISSGILKTSSRVLEFWRSSPSMERLMFELVRVGDFVGGDDGGTERAEGGKALAHRPLRGGELHVARADVVDDGVAVDVFAPG